MKAKTKTLLKSLFAMVLIVPIMFIATACGASELDKEATCNTNARYQASSMEEFDTNVRQANVENETQFKKQSGYKLTYKMNLGATVEGVKMSSKITTTVIANATQMAMKATADMDSSFATGKTTIEGYYTDNQLYMHMFPTTVKVNNSLGGLNVSSSVNIEEQKVKIDMSGMDADDAIEQYGEVKDFANVKAIMDFIKANADAKVEVSTDGLTYKITIGSATEYGMANCVVYVNIDKDSQLTALQVTGDYAAGATDIAGTTGTVTFTLCAYEGEISFPDFSDYTEGDIDLPFQF